MAHSIQIYNGRCEAINDLDLIVFIGLALDALRGSEQFNALSELAHRWQTGLAESGPGTIDLRLQELIRTPEEVRQLSLFFKFILRDLAPYGDTIPAKMLNGRNLVEGVKFEDFKVTFIKDVLSRVEALVSTKS